MTTTNKSSNSLQTLLLVTLLATGAQLHAQSTTGIYVNPSNNVGIGTTMPTQLLHLWGAANVNAALKISSDNGGANNILQVVHPTTGSSGLQVQNGGGTVLMQFDNNTGNVGIGTTSPQANLDVHAPHVYFGGAVGNSNTGAELQLRGWNTGFNNWQISTAFQASNGLDITPSTTPGGTTFTTPAVSILRNGNVGIGTTNPSFALDVSSAQAGASRMYLHPADGSDYSLLQFSNSGGTTYFGMDNSNGNGLGSGTPYALTMYSASVPIVFSTGGSERMRIDTSGNVGIGTANAAAKLQVYTANDTNPSSITAWDSRHFVVGDDASAGGIGFSYDTVNNVGYIEALKPYVAWGNLVLQSGLGNVGINTSNPQYTLDVAGDVRANSFYSNSGTYADFVFKPGYKLEPLSDVEASIKKDGHLPGIPSEAEAKAHGINLAQMQVDLLQKIEELTLHQIDEEKRLNEQSKDIEQLRKENAELREELTK